MQTHNLHHQNFCLWRILRTLLISVFFATSLLFKVAHSKEKNPITDSWANLWYCGGKSKILDIAKERLKDSGQDIPGLLLRLEYEITYLDIGNMLNTSAQVSKVLDEFESSKTNAPKFRNEIPKLKSTVETVRKVSAVYQDTKLLQVDRKKGDFLSISLCQWKIFCQPMRKITYLARNQNQ